MARLMLGLRGRLWISALALVAGAAVVVLADSGGRPATAQGASQGQRQGAQGTVAKSQPAKLAPTPESAVPAVATEEREREAREREERAELNRRLAETTAALGRHAFGLTYAAIGLMVLTISLWVMTFLQARDVRAAVRAVEAASAAAKASTALAQRALVLTQRATVVAGEPTAIWLRDVGERLVGCRLFVTWHNVGTTPTRDMVTAIAGLATEKPPLQTSALPKANARRQPAIVGPNAKINSAYVNLPIGLVTDILQHRAHYLFAGWAEYNDVFESTPRHRVEFCYWLEIEGDLEAQQLEARFHLHGRHNRHCDAEADESAVDGVRHSGPDTMAEPGKVKYGAGPVSDPQGLIP